MPLESPLWLDGMRMAEHFPCLQELQCCGPGTFSPALLTLVGSLPPSLKSLTLGYTDRGVGGFPAQREIAGAKAQVSGTPSLTRLSFGNIWNREVRFDLVAEACMRSGVEFRVSHDVEAFSIPDCPNQAPYLNIFVPSYYPLRTIMLWRLETGSFGQ